MQLRALVPEDSVGKAVEDSKEEGLCISRLLDLRVSEAGLESLNAASAAELLLIVAVILAQIGQNIEAEFTQLKMGLRARGNDGKENVD